MILKKKRIIGTPYIIFHLNLWKEHTTLIIINQKIIHL